MSDIDRLPLNDVQTQNTRSPGRRECLSCRIIGSGALGAVGVYALHHSRAGARGSLFGKRILAGLGLCFLAGSALRWT